MISWYVAHTQPLQEKKAELHDLRKFAVMHVKLMKL